jgi:hypothetical protein
MPYFLISLCWVGFGFLLLHFVLTDVIVRGSVRADGWLLISLVILAVLAAAFGYLWPFYGIEYEDAFEYTYSGIFLAYAVAPRLQSLDPVCVSGSLAHCQQFMTLAHPIGLGVLISWLHMGTSLWRHGAQVVSTFASILTCLATFLMARRWRFTTTGAMVSAVLLLITPSFLALWHTGFAEPSSAFLIICALLFSHRFTQCWAGSVSSPLRIESFHGLALLVTLLLAVLVKRENAALVAVLPVLLLLQTGVPNAGRKVGSRTIAKIAFVSVAAVLAMLPLLFSDVFSVEAIRTARAPLFSVGNFITLTPYYLLEFLRPRYMILTVPLLAALVLGIRDRRLQILVVIILAYFVLFCSFAQGREFVSLHMIPFFHFRRYTLQIAPLLALLAGVGGETAIQSVRNSRLWSIRIVQILVLLTAGICVAMSMQRGLGLKYAYYRDEQQPEIAPTLRSCDDFRLRGQIISTRPLLVSLVCGADIRVRDSEASAEIPSQARSRD